MSSFLGTERSWVCVGGQTVIPTRHVRWTSDRQTKNNAESRDGPGEPSVEGQLWLGAVVRCEMTLQIREA